MRNLLLVLLILCGKITVNAQDEFKQYGKVGLEAIDYKSCPFDKTAEAVVLSDVGESYFVQTSNSFEVVYERTTRIKIFNEAGIKWSTVEIPFYREGDVYEKVEDLEACTYNFQDGMLTKSNLDLANCHVEKINESWNQTKFAMPNVKPGSIIEYKYKIRSEYVFNLRDWEFQWKIPVLSSKYIVKMIPFYQYSWLLQKASKFDSQTSNVDQGFEQNYGGVKYHEVISEYEMKNLPAFKDEEFIATSDDYIIKLDFQLSKVIQITGTSTNIMTTWPELVNELLKNESFGGYLKKSREIATKQFDLNEFAKKTPQEKFDSVLTLMKNNFTWNKTNSKFASKSPKNFLKDKYGNAADINLFTIGLLNAVGIEAVPVIVSTRKNGRIKYDYPFSHFFNYVIIFATIDGKNILADATEPQAANDQVSIKCMNDKGLMIKKDQVNWIMLQPLLAAKKFSKMGIDISDLSQSASIETSETNQDALKSRNEFGSDLIALKKSLTNKGYNLPDSSLSIISSLPKMPYQFKYKTVDTPEIINGKIYVSPFLHEIIKDNPLKQPTRTYPIDMTYPIKRTYYSEINVPKGFKVDFVPEKIRIDNDLFEMDYNAVVDANKVVVSYSYYFKLPVYSAVDYDKIKYYFNEIIKKGNEKIAFVKN